MPHDPAKLAHLLRKTLLGLALLTAGSLAACSAPAPPAPGTPGLDLTTPLPFTPAPVLPTNTPLPPAATVPLPTATALPPANTATPVPPAATTTAVSALPTADISLPQLIITNSTGNAVRLFVEIADTPEKQETGLMHRTALAEDQGMIFVFAAENTIPFWMKDTLIPLSIAFIGADGTIVDIQDMQPLDESLHTPAHPYLTALEVNQGYFTRHGLGVGSHVLLPPLATPTP